MNNTLTPLAVLPKGPFPAPEPEDAETPIAGSIRAHLKQLLEKPLTVQRAIELGRTLKAAVQMLRATTPGVAGSLPGSNRRGGMGPYMGYGGVVDEFDVVTQPGGDWGGSVLAGAPGNETLGNSVVREFLGSISKMVEAKNQVEPEDLIRAIAAAKEAGLPEEADLLRAKLKERVEGKKVEAKDVALAASAVQDGAAMLAGGAGSLVVPFGASVVAAPIPNTPPELVLNPAGGTL